jgi:hypothetical protein
LSILNANIEIILNRNNPAFANETLSANKGHYIMSCLLQAFCL